MKNLRNKKSTVKEIERLHFLEKKVLLTLLKYGRVESRELAKRGGMDINSVMRAISWLSSKSLIKIDEKIEKEYELLEEGKKYAELKLPERRALEIIAREKNKEAELNEIEEKLGKQETKIAMIWLIKKGLARVKNGKLRMLAYKEETEDEKALAKLSKGKIKLSEADEIIRKGISLLLKRKNVIKEAEKVLKFIELSDKGKELAKEIEKLGLEEEITELTHEMLLSKSWKNKKFKKYDVLAEVRRKLPAKLHPLSRMISQIREIFISMGFREIRSKIIENAFWNFDALFVPQEHPAREMQDTFYLEEPGAFVDFDENILKKVKHAHENGTQYSSKGWSYRFSDELARKALLRTHTTATTIRYLASMAEKGESEAKVFSIGRVYRKERVTFKHLPEFHQIEGIVVGNVNFANLLSILREFYARMGFKNIRFRPAYFPYTEPSLEIEVFLEEKAKWIELGGAGIFRPEVTLPFGIDKPVLAFGLGLERLAMLKLEIEDIRMLYRSDVTWLSSLKL